MGYALISQREVYHMPAKKTEAKTTAVKKAAPKATVKKAAPKKEVKKEEIKVEEVKKEEVKKEEVKKAPAKKAAVKKAPAKKEAPVDMKSVQDYVDIINWKKGEAHAMDWLYIEINAGDLLEEVEAGKSNLRTVCNAIVDCMLEGDAYMNEPVEADKVNSSLTVRYYCDNLSESRKKYFAR
jgi:hypothetical protein